jgi:hypothetical protein
VDGGSDVRSRQTIAKGTIFQAQMMHVDGAQIDNISFKLDLASPGNWGLLKKPDRLQRNWSQRSRGIKLAMTRAIEDCFNC